MKFVRYLDDLDGYKLSKGEIFLHKNFKLPFFFTAIFLFGFIWFKVYNSSFVDFFSNINYSMIFFAASLFFFFFLSLRVVMDIFSIIFGQKGQNTLSSKASRK